MKRNTFIFGLSTVIFIVAFSYYNLRVFTPQIAQREQTIQFWDISYEPSFTPMGIMLNQTTLEAAITRFGNRFDLAVYVEQDGALQLEIYFRETEVGTLTGRVPATLNATKAEIEALIARADKGKVLPDKRHKYVLNETEYLNFLGHTFSSVAFIPTAVRLSESDIHGRFGIEDQIIKEKTADGILSHYLFAKKGLTISISYKGASLVQYVLPEEFESKVLAPLKTLEKLGLLAK